MNGIALPLFSSHAIFEDLFRFRQQRHAATALQHCDCRSGAATTDHLNHRHRRTDRTRIRLNSDHNIRETVMLKMFRRRRKSFVWSPSVDFSDRRIAAALFSFPSN
ncbi:MAG: hypothetical protein KDJ16_13750 [Hyphomicrobiales bacterium]|nr:hypothetical protein [Hyphomicrobiales bacterium]